MPLENRRRARRKEMNEALVMLEVVGIRKLKFQEAAPALNRLSHLKNSRCITENFSNCYDFAHFLPQIFFFVFPYLLPDIFV